MIFNIALYASCLICLAGILYRVAAWFRPNASQRASGNTFIGISLSFAKGVFLTIFSIRIFRVFQTLFLDVIFQKRTLKAGRIRWFSHFSMSVAFLALVLLHAMDKMVTTALFEDYASTLYPFMLLRNLLGAFVLLGIGVAFYRRFLKKKTSFRSNGGDRTAVLILAVIIISGFALEAVQIISEPIFNQMVEDYAGIDNPDELKPLKSFWAKDYGVVFSESPLPATPAQLALGLEIHEENCASCHSRPSQAFLSYPMAKLIHSPGIWLNHVRADKWLWYLHFLSCFAGLAYLPFSKFFHLISIPANLMAMACKDKFHPDSPVGIALRKIGMDACTHCGVCTDHCSVAPVFQIIPNSNILPSEKLGSIKRLQSSSRPGPESMKAIAMGSYICTECLKCTEVCPSGIDLQTLWLESNTQLNKEGLLRPHQWIKKHKSAQWAVIAGANPLPGPENILKNNSLVDSAESFAACVQCTICTNVCPVVAAAGKPENELDFTPQQIMNLLRLDLKELAIGSRMVWDCVTCYLCQENCPQDVRVADILFELRNLACETFQNVNEFNQDEPGPEHRMKQGETV